MAEQMILANNMVERPALNSGVRPLSVIENENRRKTDGQTVVGG